MLMDKEANPSAGAGAVGAKASASQYAYPSKDKKPWCTRNSKLVCFLLLLAAVGLTVGLVLGLVVFAPKGTTVTVQGQALDTSGSTITNGNIVDSNGNNMGVVNSDGSFIVQVSADGDGIASFIIVPEGSDYAPHILAVRTVSGVSTYFRNATIPLLTSVPFIGSVGLQTTGFLPNGQNVTFIVTAVAGETGTFFFKYATLSASQGPGLLESVDTGASGSNTLQSGGMFYFDVVDSLGNEAPQFKVKVTGTVSMANIDGADAANFYEMDPFQGKAVWSTTTELQGHLSRRQLQNGEGNIVALPDLGVDAAGRRYANIDRNVPVSCVVVKTSSQGGNTCPGAHVNVKGVDGIFTQGHSGSDGSVCVEGAAGYTSTLSAGGSGVNVNFPRTAGTCRNQATCTVINAPVPAPSNNCGTKAPTPAPVPGGGDGGNPGDFDCDTDSLQRCIDNLLAYADSLSVDQPICPYINNVYWPCCISACPAAEDTFRTYIAGYSCDFRQ